MSTTKKMVGCLVSEKLADRKAATNGRFPILVWIAVGLVGFLLATTNVNALDAKPFVYPDYSPTHGVFRFDQATLPISYEAGVRAKTPFNQSSICDNSCVVIRYCDKCKEYILFIGHPDALEFYYEFESPELTVQDTTTKTTIGRFTAPFVVPHSLQAGRYKLRTVSAPESEMLSIRKRAPISDKDEDSYIIVNREKSTFDFIFRRHSKWFHELVKFSVAPENTLEKCKRAPDRCEFGRQK